MKVNAIMTLSTTDSMQGDPNIKSITPFLKKKSYYTRFIEACKLMIQYPIFNLYINVYFLSFAVCTKCINN
jgi:hypothetical protein